MALWAAPCVSSHRPLEYFSIAFSCGFGIGRFTNLNPIKKWHFYDISFSIHRFEARSMRLSVSKRDQNGNEVHKHTAVSFFASPFTVFDGFVDATAAALKWSIVCLALFGNNNLNQKSNRVKAEICEETVRFISRRTRVSGCCYFLFVIAHLECCDDEIDKRMVESSRWGILIQFLSTFWLA